MRFASGNGRFHHRRMKARIFISCGQRKDSHELQIAREIADRLVAKGYDPYIAVAEQTLRGVKENIFARLSQSEYFLFIDFRREQIVGATPDSFRGSLFSHQELAIASYLNKDVIAFQEAGVLRLDGIIGFVQANAREFVDHAALPDLVMAEVSRRWRNDWRNELKIERDRNQHTDEQHPGRHPTASPRQVRYFHLKVRNLNPFQNAFGCVAYLESIRRTTEAEEIPTYGVEYKWRAVKFPAVIIPAQKSREFDAFRVYYDSPSEVVLSPMTDSHRHMDRLPSPGEYLLTFVVRSENFAEARGVFRLAYDGRSIEGVEFCDPPRQSVAAR